MGLPEPYNLYPNSPRDLQHLTSHGVLRRANPDLVKRFELDAHLNKCAACLWLVTWMMDMCKS